MLMKKKNRKKLRVIQSGRKEGPPIEVRMCLGHGERKSGSLGIHICRFDVLAWLEWNASSPWEFPGERV